MSFSFETLHNTSSEDFLYILFGSDYESDTSLPTTIAPSAVFNQPPPPPPGTGQYASHQGPRFALLAVETWRDRGCQYIFFDPLCKGRQTYFKQWDKPRTPCEDAAIKAMWAERLHPNSPRPATPQMLSLWLQGRF
ncbi:hypothetical protein L202_07425 [Cryptococcus amylolentus CBS 6039]|uniref:Uncharacterized protein n=1 Tax=Cryptococcus amylolentus CBS 6039 TaxID=1295533 RepID=A0A1E3HC48_9TREE|nr:hypothetical protein L202_07425 [Cryptococcus amylolentus CBS 6039]ODN73919.1 hypothetical protein L202_07425 [Cryptococcus amylolentus CBS 6039]